MGLHWGQSRRQQAQRATSAGAGDAGDAGDVSAEATEKGRLSTVRWPFFVDMASLPFSVRWKETSPASPASPAVGRSDGRRTNHRCCLSLFGVESNRPKEVGALRCRLSRYPRSFEVGRCVPRRAKWANELTMSE